MILSPISAQEIVMGEILWAASKGTLSALGIVLIGLPLGLVDTWLILPALGVIFISAFLFAALGMLVTSWVKNYDSIIYPTSGLIVPMSLLCGTYFSIEKLPPILKYLTYLLPLTHTVALTRGLLLQGFDWLYIVNIAVLVGLSLIFYRLSSNRIAQRLVS
jgi:lipooligosaccharide transport system permease protein